MKSELLITVIIFVLLLIKLGRGMSNEALLSLAQVLLLAAVVLGCFYNEAGSLFDGMYYSSSLIAAQKIILGSGAYLLTLLFGDLLKKTEHLAEYLILLLSALLGMYFMISSGNLLMFFLSLELSTIPIAAMANFDLDKRISSEAAMKMILSSAFSSGVLLFGISLVYGIAGTLRFAELPAQLSQSPLMTLAMVFLFAGFAFKLSIVPFHLWTADVYQGAPIATTSFLSVVSKGSIAFILLSALYKAFQPLQSVWHPVLVVLSVCTMLVGNLFALRQQNIKRFLAFSSIAQVGFILVAMSGEESKAVSAVVFFMLVYLFSNFAAFGVAGLISAQTGKEKIHDYKGLHATNPFLSWVLALALFSLAGIPPTAGFFGKLFLLAAGAARGNYWLITIAALNMIVSLYYYLRVVRSMFMDKNEQVVNSVIVDRPARFALIICTAGIVFAGIFSWLYEFINQLS